MYISDRHPDREKLLNRESADAPVPQGETLFDLERDRKGKRERVRGSLEQYGDRGYVRIQVWERGSAGRWWPTQCVTLKLGWLPEIVEALGQLGPDARPSRESSPWSDDPPPLARQERRGATGGGSADARPVEPPRRAVAAPARPPAVPHERPNGRRAVPDDPRRRWDPSTLPSPADVIGSPDFDETSA